MTRVNQPTLAFYMMLDQKEEKKMNNEQKSNEFRDLEPGFVS